MENVTLDRAAEIARALRPEEQLQLRAMIDSWQTPAPAETTPEQQRRLAEHLFAEGMIENLPARYREGYDPEDDADRHPPIMVKGRPVSETLLEDREPR
jgi:hypothetical protein